MQLSVSDFIMESVKQGDLLEKRTFLRGVIRRVSTEVGGTISHDQHIYLFTCSIKLHEKIKNAFFMCFCPRFSSLLIHNLPRKTLYIFSRWNKKHSPLCRGSSNLPRTVLARTDLQSLVISCTELYYGMCKSTVCVFTCLYPGTRLWVSIKKWPYLTYLSVFNPQHCF